MAFFGNTFTIANDHRIERDSLAAAIFQDIAIFSETRKQGPNFSTQRDKSRSKRIAKHRYRNNQTPLPPSENLRLPSRHTRHQNGIASAIWAFRAQEVAVVKKSPLFGLLKEREQPQRTVYPKAVDVVRSSSVYSKLPVVRATGTGSTGLAAFHAALMTINAGQYNLIRLSSVIPPQTVVDVSGTTPIPTGAWGDRLYCVYAEHRAHHPGEQAWAGIGWVQRLNGEGGFFVEHEGNSEEHVTAALDSSLRDLVAGHEATFSASDQMIAGATCVGSPVCALVLAAYETAPWLGAR